MLNKLKSLLFKNLNVALPESNNVDVKSCEKPVTSQVNTFIFFNLVYSIESCYQN